MNVKIVYVEITNRCNLNCATCYNRSGLNKKTSELSFEKIEDIIKLFIPYGLQRFLLSGGEPTLHSEFDKILNLIDKYPEINFGVVTNGINHNELLIEYLNTRKNFSLQISLDGSNEFFNSKTRGKGNFKKTLTFAKKVNNKNYSNLLKMVVSQSNYEDVENFCHLALSIGFTPEIAFIYNSGNGSDNWDKKSLTSQQKIKILNLIQKINYEKNAEIFLPLCTNKCPFADENFNELSLCIKVDGTIQPCQMIYNDEYSLGNALKFNENLFFQQLYKISDWAKKRFETDYGCKKCITNGFCGKGCMAESINSGLSPISDDGNCEYRKQQFINFNLKRGIFAFEKQNNTLRSE